MRLQRGRIACVSGDLDLVRALGLGGIRSVVLAERGAPPRYSRFCVDAWTWPDPWCAPEAALATLERVAQAYPDRPILFYQCDADLLLVSRHRQKLSGMFRFVIADATLIEDLVDKGRFQMLATGLDLPVPRGVVVVSGQEDGDLAALRFPVVIKPVVRQPGWMELTGGAKVMLAPTRPQLSAFMATLPAGTRVVVQELIEGPESGVESYHVYSDPDGAIVADFTGKKIRTYPVRHGDSTALVTTDQADLLRLGRKVIARLGLTGVAKLDFKRAPDGRLYLLEVNPRFTLWHHLAAVAGLNVPAMVHADLTGGPRPGRTTARPGVRWCRQVKDITAARGDGVSMGRWLQWAWACEAQTPLTIDDPWPLLGAACWRASGAVARLWHAALATAPTSY